MGSFNDEYQKLRKKRKENQGSNDDTAPTMLYQNKTLPKEDVAPIVTANGNKKDVFDDGYQFGDVTKKIIGTGKDWGIIKEENAFSDGYQIGDVAKTILSSGAEFGVSLLEGAGGLVEGVTDLAGYGIAGVGDLFGADQFAETLKESAKKNTVQGWGEDIREWTDIDQNSIFGGTIQSFGEGLGYVLGMVGTGAIGGAAGLGATGVSVLTTGATGLSSMGSGIGEAYEGGATDEEAALYGVINGVVNAGSELLFGGLGKAVNALGISRGIGGLDDMFARKVSEKISNAFCKTVVQYGIKASAEGFEEVIAGVGQAVGKKLTYMSDEDLGKLIEDEHLLEQFAMGAAISGVMQIPDAAISIKNKTDFVTGMTKEQEAAYKDEQTVVENIVNEKVAEQEKDGEKLTAKEKRDIRKQIERDLERGYISVDDIERILGGEAYESYVNTANEQKTLQDEYDTLYKMKNGEKSDEQIDRQKELKAKLEEITQKDAATTLKTQLSEDVFGRVKAGRLAESYNERARRGQAFEADLSKYDTKQGEIVKKAVEIGILNNTNRTHEFVDMVAKISADKGVLFDFTNNTKLKESGFAVEGATVNGYFDNKTGTIGVNIDSAKAFDTVVGHEITHVLEGTELYSELQKAVFDYAKTKGEYDSRREALAKLYAEGDIDSEMTADLIGEYLFTDEKFVKSLSVTNRNVFQKIYDEIKYLVKVVTAGSKEARELERVKRAFDKAYREQGAKADVKSEDFYDAETKHSLTVKDQKTLDFLDNQETITTYKTMQLVDGKLYPPMAARTDGKYEDASELGVWEQATEHPELIKNGNKFKLDKGKGQGSIEAAYNPYMHSSNLVLNDQFSGAYKRDNLVTVECEVPVSEMTSGYHAEFAKDSVGWHPWHTGTVAGQLRQARGTERQVFLSRWIKPVRIVPDSEVAAMYKELLDGTDVEVPDNVVTPSLLKELKKAGVKIKESGRVQYSLSDSDGKQLSKGQQEYFKDSKMRDENGNLKVMYHGSQDAGFHVFDPGMSDDDISFFFVDRNDVAASYSGTYETYEAKAFKSAEDANKFFAEIGKDEYAVIEHDGLYSLFDDGDEVATSADLSEIYQEFCDYEGVGYGDANYKVYLNLKNPLVVDGKGRPWNKIDAEFSQEVYDKYQSLTAEEKDALIDLAEWEDFSLFNSEIQEATEGDLASAYAKMGEDCNIYDLFSVAADHFSEESMRENARGYLKTRDYAQRAKEQGYDGVIFNNIVDNGGYSNGSEGASTVAIAFESSQIKSVANENPTGDKDIRYSLSKDNQGKELSAAQRDYFKDSKVVDENGSLKVMYHGTPNGDFSVFKDGTYFTENKWYADLYQNPGASSISTGKVATNPKTYEVYLDIKNPFDISDAEARSIYINDYIKGGNAVGINPYLSDAEYDKIDSIDWTEGEDLREFLIDNGYDYDGLVLDEGAVGGYGDDVKYRGKSYVVFSPEQIKNVDNVNPTSNPDIHKSLSTNGEAPGKGRFYGKDIRLDVAPVAETVGETKTETAPEAVAPVNDWMPEPEETYTPSLYDLRDERDALQEMLRAAMDSNDQESALPLAQRYQEVTAQIQQLEADENARLASLDDSDVPPEVEAPYIAQREPITIDDKSLDKITGEVSDMLGLNAEDRARMAQTIQNYSQNSEMTEGDLFDEILDNYEYYEEMQVENDEADAARRFIKGTKLFLPENLKGDFDGKRKDGFNAFRREHFGHFTITTQEGAGARSVDSLYQELGENFPELFPDDIWNAAEQLQRMAEVASMKPETEYHTGQFDPDTVGEAVEMIRSGVAGYAHDEKFKAFNKEGDRLIRMYGKTLAPVVDTPTIETASKSEIMGQQTMFEEPAKKDRFEQMLEREMAELEKEFAQRRSEMETRLKDKNAYISSRAMELYNEISNLKKGVRASRELGYLLDHGFAWRTIKSKLLTIKRYPGEVINPDSVEESTIREMLSREYEDKVYELSELGNEYQRKVSEIEQSVERARKEAEKAEQLIRRAELHKNIVDRVRSSFAAKGFDFDKVLKNAKNLSTFATVDNTPQRVMEKALGYKQGQILADETVNKVAQNETEGIKWLNSYTDRKSGLLAKISKQYHIKPGSKESAAAQMYAEGFFVSEQGDTIFYGDAELAKDFPDAQTQENIKGLAGDPRIRQIYDETLAMINESRVRNGYPEIQKLDNYFLHFRAMDDTFSRLGLPFNPNDIKAKDLPTDLNGVTADLKPGQPYFASAMHRRGVRTTHDLLGGLERYLTSAKSQIYHIDDIQTLRALRNYIADTYGQANGLESLDALTEEEVEERIKQVYGAHLSTFAKFLNEEANVIAGKTALIDRGLEGIIGRRGMTFMDSINKQVGSNMVGFNVSSSLTNFLPVVQAFAKTNKFAFVKGFAQTVSNKVGSIVGNGDGFAQNSPVMIRRKGADRFYRTPYQKAADAGYALMGAVDSISTEIIARAKYNELTRKGLTSAQAHTVTDKWVSRLMGDRSLGQMPQLYNSKMLGLVTKFQLEVRNQLDSQFYDTIQEAKVSNEHIENQLARNAKTAAKVASTFFQLAVAQHVFGKVFEAIAGYNPAFDIIEVIMTALGWDDEEDSEDTVLDNVEQGFLALLEDLPYTSTLTGGRIPISNALPIEQLIKGKDDYGNDKPRWKTALEALPYYVLPGGYGQAKKTAQGLSMFSDKLPVTGSYTDSGNLRFPVEETPGNVAQAAVFGQWANENARYYFDNDIAPLKPKQTQEYADVGMSIRDYWKYRKGLSGLSTLEEKAAYIDSLDLTDEQKNILINNIADREEDIDMSDYDQYGSFSEFDFAAKNPEKYEFFKANGISYEDYDNADEDGKRAYTWAYENPEKYTVAKAISDDFLTYYKYKGELYDIKADKDENGETIRGSAKDKKIDYINNLDLDYGQKIILLKSLYNADDTYNEDIIDYLNEREDISYDEMVTILTELGFTVKNGHVYWD